MTITARSLASLTALGSAALIAAVLTSALPAQAAPLPPRCLTNNLETSLEHPVSQLGNAGAVLVEGNRGTAACTIRGYPKLGLTRHGHHLRSTTTDGPTYFQPDPGASVIVLAPHATATAYVGYGTVSGSGNVTASRLTVRIDGARWHHSVPLPGGPLSITNGHLSVTAWQMAREG